MSLTGVFPAVFRNGDTTVAELRDSNGKVWATGNGTSRSAAIAEARTKLPPRGMIRSVLGWTTRHPILASSAVTGLSWAFGSQGRRVTIGKVVAVFFAAFLMLRYGRKVFGDNHEPETLEAQ